MKEFPRTKPARLSRREFLKTASGLVLSAAGMTLLEACGVKPTDQLETTSIKLAQTVLCIAPQYVAEEALKSEGFTDVQYVKTTTGVLSEALVSGDVDISMHFSAPSIIQIDAGERIVFLAGVHVGCWKLLGASQVETIQDLKGKSVAITEIGGSDHVFLSSITAYIGLDPNKDINWVTHPVKESKQLFTDGKLDAFLAFPPVAQELQDEKIGHVVLDSMMDNPWSGYFCCMVTTSRDFMNKNPVATKRALSAILKASDLCALQPEKAARLVVDKGITDNYDYALQAMQEIPYNRWRELDPDDTLRFYSLQLREAGMIKSNPDQIIKQGSDWTFLNELKNDMQQ